MAEGAVRKFLKAVLRGDRRRAGRYSVGGAGDLRNAGVPLEVTIHDLSLSGALVAAPALPPAGSRVALCAECLDAQATVVWSEGGRAGLRFDRALSVEQLFTIVHRSRFSPGPGIPAALAA